MNSHDKSDITSLISKEANKINERKINVDVSFEEWGENGNIKIYIKGQHVIQNTYYKLICDGEVYNVGVKLCDKDGIIFKFTYKNKNKIIYNPDYYMVNTTIENLNNRNIEIKYKCQNQKLSTLSMEFLQNQFST